MFFRNSIIRFFNISWLNCEQFPKNQYKKKEQKQNSSVFKVLKITFILFNHENSTVKIQNLIVNQESQPIKSNPVLENEKDRLSLKIRRTN